MPVDTTTREFAKLCRDLKRDRGLDELQAYDTAIMLSGGNDDDEGSPAPAKTAPKKTTASKAPPAATKRKTRGKDASDNDDPPPTGCMTASFVLTDSKNIWKKT